jgi:phytoene dehydrogenase-like protein
LRIVERPLLNYLVEGAGRGLRIGPTGADTLHHLAARSPRDAERHGAYQAQLETGVALLKGLLTRTPPTDLKRFGDLWSALSVGRAFRNLPIESQRVVHELFTRSAGDLLDGWFEDAGLKAAYGFDSIVGTYASPYTPGSAYVLLHRAKPSRMGHASKPMPP